MAPQILALAAPDRVLFLWAIDPMLPQALALIEAWGLEYKTVAFTWVKTLASAEESVVVKALAGEVAEEESRVFHGGLGYWTRANPEVCLLATRGRPRRLDRDVDQLIVAPRGAHSAKPAEARVRIGRLVAGPYLELFARQTPAGWTVWGNEAETRGRASNSKGQTIVDGTDTGIVVDLSDRLGDAEMSA
jgi:N6-adenosine-specific RNA methylase IME4